MAKKDVVTRFEGTVYTHRVLMHTAEHLLGQAEGQRRGSYHNALGAMLFAWLAFEAYLNHVIEHLDPVTFKDEQNYFTRRNGFAGIRGKLRWILQKLHVAPPRPAERRRRTVLQLHTLRDQLAHAKPMRYTGVVYHSKHEERPGMGREWVAQHVTVARARRYVDAVAQFSEWLHGRVRPRFDDPHMRSGAFNGTSQGQTSKTSSRLARRP